MTTTKKENRAAHARWEWEFGDGQVSSDDGMPSLSKPHRYDEPGRYRATARSVDAEGTVLGTYRWDVNVEEPGGKEVLFEVAALSEPEVSLGIEGPKEWIVGRPARFEVDIELACEEGHEIGEMYYSPAKSFEVQWERPGRYEVRAAVTFRVKAAPPNGSFNAWVTRVAVKEVNVLATSSSG